MSQPVNKQMRLGDLLKAISAVDGAELVETLKLAVQAGLPLGRALVLAGHLTEEELEAALEIQQLIRRSSMGLAAAETTFGFVRSGLSLQESLKLAGWESAGERLNPNRLGTLLFDARIITREQLDSAQRSSYETGMPFGRTLCMMGAISQALLLSSLELQRRLRSSEITHNQAVHELQNYRQSAASSSQAGSAPAFSSLAALANSGRNSAQPSTLDSPAQIGSNTSGGAIYAQSDAATAGANATSGSLGTGQSFAGPSAPIPMTAMEKHFSPSNRKRIRLAELFMMAGVLTENDIFNALEYGLISTRPLGDVLVEMGLMTQAILQLSLNLQDSLSTGELDLRAALDALCYVAGSKQPGIELPAIVPQTALKTTNESKTAGAASANAETAKVDTANAETANEDTAEVSAVKATSSAETETTGHSTEGEGSSSTASKESAADDSASTPPSVNADDKSAPPSSITSDTSDTAAGDQAPSKPVEASGTKQKLTDLWGLGSDDDAAKPFPKIKRKKTSELKQTLNEFADKPFAADANSASSDEEARSKTNKPNGDQIDIQIPDTEFVLDNDPEKRLEEEEQRFERQFNQARRPPQQAGSVKLGELLTMSGFIEESDISQAIELGRQHPTLLGKMLVSSGAIEEGALLSALRCQFLMRNGHIQVEDAVKALQLARTNRISLDDALDELDVPIPVPKESKQ